MPLRSFSREKYPLDQVKEALSQPQAAPALTHIPAAGAVQ
jgi:hypothetical protein